MGKKQHEVGHARTDKQRHHYHERSVRLGEIVKVVAVTAVEEIVGPHEAPEKWRRAGVSE